MVDVEAPIVPGKSAAGISIGGLVSELVATAPTAPTKNFSGAETYDLGSVKVWAGHGVITQICVYSGCRGVLEPGVRIGSTIADVEESFGCSVEEDEADNLMVPNSPGWCFETEPWTIPKTVSKNRNAKIISICVF